MAGCNMLQRTGKLLTWLLGSSVLRSFPRNAVSDPLKEPAAYLSKLQTRWTWSTKFGMKKLVLPALELRPVYCPGFAIWFLELRSRQNGHVTDIMQISRCLAA